MKLLIWAFLLGLGQTTFIPVPNSTKVLPSRQRQEESANLNKKGTDLILLPVKHVRTYFQPGEPIGKVQVGVKHQVDGSTLGAGEKFKDFSIRFAISTDSIFKPQKSVSVNPLGSEQFKEDMFLKHSEIKITEVFPPNKNKFWLVNLGNLPVKMAKACKQKKFFLVVLLDYENQVAELNESNNMRLIPMSICVEPPIGSN